MRVVVLVTVDELVSDELIGEVSKCYRPPYCPSNGIVVMFVPGCLDSTQVRESNGRRAGPLPSEDEESSPRVSGNGLAAPDVRCIMSPRRKPVGSVPRAALLRPCECFRPSSGAGRRRLSPVVLFYEEDDGVDGMMMPSPSFSPSRSRVD